VSMRVNDRTWTCTARVQQCIEEAPRVHGRRAGFQHERPTGAHHPTERRTVGQRRRHPIDVVGDPRKGAHPVVEYLARLAQVGSVCSRDIPARWRRQGRWGLGVAQDGCTLCAAALVQRFVLSFQPVAVACPRRDRVNSPTLDAATRTSCEVLGNLGTITQPLRPSVISSWHESTVALPELGAPPRSGEHHSRTLAQARAAILDHTERDDPRRRQAP
jgi:hypothetical protein